MSAINKHRRIFLIICCCLLFVMLWKQSKVNFDRIAIRSEVVNVISTPQEYSDHRLCLIQAIENRTELWAEFADIVSVCSQQYLKDIKLKKYQNKDEIKYAIIPDDLESVSRCNVVTLGIGNDTLAERQMLQRMPWCRFYGADPVNYRTLYESMGGSYYRMKVNTASGASASSTIPQVGIVEFLKSVLKIDNVDHLLMDIEGPEWHLLPFFERNATLAQNNITVCQLNVEFHDRPPNFQPSTSLFANIVINLLKNSNFVPVITSYRYVVIRQFWMNVGDAYCIRKFLLSE